MPQRAGITTGSKTAAALAAMALLIVLARTRTFNEPLERDLLTYATIGHEMLSGQRLYTDVWDVKPPGLYATYALAERIAGHGAAAVFLLGVGAALATLLAVYAGGAAIGTKAGLWSAAFWTVLCGTLVIQANQPNSEVFINGCYAGGFALLVRHPPGRAAWGRMALVGLLLAFGSTYKPILAILAVFVLAAHFLAPPAGLPRKTVLAESLVVGAMGLLVWGAIFGYAVATGQAAIYWATNVTMNGARSAGLLFNLYRYLREGKIFPANLLFVAPAVVLVVVGTAVGLRRGWQREWVLFVGLALGVHAMIVIQGGAFHPHSYQLWLPTLALGVGWATATVSVTAPPSTSGHPSTRPWLGDVLAGVALAVVLVHEVPNYTLSSDDWARRKYGETVVEDRAFAYAVSGLLLPSETLFEYGDGAAFYYYGGLRPTTPTLWTSQLLSSTALAAQLGAVTLQALKSHPPDLLVIHSRDEWRPQAPTRTPGLAARLLGRADQLAGVIAWDQHPIYEWAMANYRPWQPDARLGVRSTHLDLFVHTGSALDRRLVGN
ncbi:MAG TPA: hypothetical protein VGL59_16330 [Polyangia bacterium]